MSTVTEDLKLEYATVGRGDTVQVSAVLDGQVVHTDKLDIGRATARQRFAKTLTGKNPTIDAGELEAELLRIADEVTLPAPAPGAVDAMPEVDTSRIIRPELFHTVEVSGIAVPVVTLASGEPVGRWALYVQWTNGRRERRELTPSIDLPDASSLWLNPIPAKPATIQEPGWSAKSRRAWLKGADAPAPVDVFKRLCERLAWFLEFQPETAKGNVSLLALWVVLTYGYPIWPAIPYLSIGGPLGSGKSRVFELLARLVFRPILAANLTAPTLFRTLHESGGTLLLDEAERLRDSTPDAGELRSILLSGYKKGNPARRLEPTGDGKFITRSFDVFGPKAIAAIANPPPVLASRCIRLTMFRAAPGSPKPRRHVDADLDQWRGLRDDLHALALEHGAMWLQLAGRPDVCPAMSGRDFELWQPILALAYWVDEFGADGLLSMMQDHAARCIELNQDDITPDADELLLKLLAESVMAGTNGSLASGELLRRANEKEPTLFVRWSTRGVSNALKRYGLTTAKSHGRRTYRDVTPAQLVQIERAYGLDLGLPDGVGALSSGG